MPLTSMITVGTEFLVGTGSMTSLWGFGGLKWKELGKRVFSEIQKDMMSLAELPNWRTTSARAFSAFAISDIGHRTSARFRYWLAT